MSYPSSVYSGQGGEVSASLRRRDADPDLVYRDGHRVDYLATGHTTGGGLGLYRWAFERAASGPDPHFHRTIWEYFFVLSGQMAIYEGTRWVEAGPGDFVTVPPGGVHGFRHEEGDPASMLVLFTPGAPREEYFETLKALDEGLVMSDDELAEFFIEHDTYWV